jgi:hypothetical protein
MQGGRLNARLGVAQARGPLSPVLLLARTTADLSERLACMADLRDSLITYKN